MKKIKILQKSFSKPISCLTAYSPSIANILDGKVDLILVGDSIGSTLYGMKNTQGVTMDMMKNHGAAVNKAIKKSLKVSWHFYTHQFYYHMFCRAYLKLLYFF